MIPKIFITFWLLVMFSSTCLARYLPSPHPAVQAVDNEEKFLPDNLRSRIRHNPHLRELLLFSSLLHTGETEVYDRDTDKIPRRKVYNLLTHAGFVPRRVQTKHSANHLTPNIIFQDSSLFLAPEVLQYL